MGMVCFRFDRVLRNAGCIGLVGFAGALTGLVHAGSSAPFVHEGRAGFVVSDIKYALGPDAEEEGLCPNGLSLQVEEIYQLDPEGQRRAGESDDEYQARLREARDALSTAPDGDNICMNPEKVGPDPHYRTVQSSDVAVGGIPLGDTWNGENASRQRSTFPSKDGFGQVENQFYRVVGCSRAFQPRAQSNGFATEMLTGAWGILFSLDDVDDIRNDDHVEVGIYANGDPIQLSPNREPLDYATYLVKDDPRFQGRTTGRIEGGVLTTEPVDVRFVQVVNSMILERPLRDARLHVTLSEDGVMEGYLSGYTPVEGMYDFQFGYRTGKTRSGELAPLRLRMGSANGAAHVLGHTCNGVYHALHEHADGHPDPETGKFTSISTQYRIEAVPAFVADPGEEQAAKRAGRRAEAGQ